MKKTSCGLPNCFTCEVHNTPCPPDSCKGVDVVCFIRGETGACEHTTKIMEDIRARRQAEEQSK